MSVAPSSIELIVGDVPLTTLPVPVDVTYSRAVPQVFTHKIVSAAQIGSSDSTTNISAADN